MALANFGTTIVLISQPCKRKLRFRKNWFYDKEQLTAIKLMNTNVSIKREGQGRGLLQVTNCIQEGHLVLVSQKTEVLLIKRKKINPISFPVQKVNISPSSAVKYLGVRLDTKLNFKVHADKIAQKTATQ